MRRKAIRASFRPTSTSELIQDAMNTPPMAQERVQSNYKVVISSPRTILTPASCVATTKCLICQDDLPKASFVSFSSIIVVCHLTHFAACTADHRHLRTSQWNMHELFGPPRRDWGSGGPCQMSSHNMSRCSQLFRRTTDRDTGSTRTVGYGSPNTHPVYWYALRYDEILLRQELQKDPNFLWCQNPECECGQIHSRGVAAPLMICHSCNFSSCFKHELPEIVSSLFRRWIYCLKYIAPTRSQAKHCTSLILAFFLCIR